MKSLLSSRLVQPFAASLSHGVSFLQYFLMKIAVAISLKLCWFAARTLLNGPARA